MTPLPLKHASHLAEMATNQLVASLFQVPAPQTIVAKAGSDCSFNVQRVWHQIGQCLSLRARVQKRDGVTSSPYSVFVKYNKYLSVVSAVCPRFLGFFLCSIACTRLFCHEDHSNTPKRESSLTYTPHSSRDRRRKSPQLASLPLRETRLPD